MNSPYYWTGRADNNWSNPLNWAPGTGQYPGQRSDTDWAIFDGTYKVNGRPACNVDGGALTFAKQPLTIGRLSLWSGFEKGLLFFVNPVTVRVLDFNTGSMIGPGPLTLTGQEGYSWAGNHHWTGGAATNQLTITVNPTAVLTISGTQADNPADPARNPRLYASALQNLGEVDCTGTLFVNEQGSLNNTANGILKLIGSGAIS